MGHQSPVARMIQVLSPSRPKVVARWLSPGWFVAQVTGDIVTRYVRRQAGNVFIDVWSFVSRITQNLLSPFSQNFGGRLTHTGRGRNHCILVLIRVTC